MKNSPFLPSLLFLFLILSLTTVKGQNIAAKWGKVSPEEKALKRVSFDKEAHAVIISETGTLAFTGLGFSVQRHCRIKILDHEGIEEASIVLPYYKKDRFQAISKVKAQTLEIQANGKVVKHKLKKSEIYDVETDENWAEVRFALPAAKPGNIIEYSYTFHTANFTFLEGWVFQNDIPTLYSSFKADIPNTLTYSTLLQGNRLYNKYATTGPGNKWSLENLPALKSEPFTYNLMDHAEKIQFQLQKYKTRSGAYQTSSEKSVLTDWQAIGNEVLSSMKARQYLNSNRLPADITSRLGKSSKASQDSMQGAREIYAFVQQHIEWSKNHGILPDKPIKDLLKDRKGNGSAINLLLTSLLENAGYNAVPALISTKMHGRVSPKYPLLSQFNHTVCRLQLEGKEYLLDAAGQKLPFGILPVKDLNYHALLLTSETSWIEIKDSSRSKTVVLCSSDLASGLHTFNCKWQGYDALKLEASFSLDQLPKLHNTRGTLQPDSTRITKLFPEQATLEASFLYKEEPHSSDQRIYYQLPIPESFQSNPFKTEKRNLPIDFGYPFSRQLVYNIKLPPGYILEESPENLLLRTPDGQATFLFQAGATENTLHVQLSLSINKHLFQPDQYLNLRELYSKMIMQCEQPLVLLPSPDQN